MKTGNLGAILIALVFVGCVHSDSVDCSFGVCPTGSMCDEVNHACIPPGCGDGVVNNAEDCDGAIPAGVDCTSFGYYVGSGLACSPSCTFDQSQCAGICGDHTINGPELCDGIPPAGETCANFGYQIGRIGCTLDCAPGLSNCGTIGWQVGRGNAPDELHAVWGGGQGNMYAVGRQGAILHGNGVVWLPMVSGTTQHLNGVWGAGADNVIAVGDAGTILHFDGTSWSAMTSGTTVNLYAVSGTSNYSDVWATGDAGTILHFSHGAWALEASGTTAALRGIWALNVVSPVAVGDATTMGTAAPTALQRINGVWTAMTTPTIAPVAGATTPVSLSAVWGQDAGFIAVGDANINSGTARGSVMQVNTAVSTNWVFAFQTLSPNDLKSVWGVSANGNTDVFIGGLFGTLLHYNGTPGATNYRLYDSNTTRGLSGLWGTDAAFVRATTLGGEVQEFDGTDVIATDLALPGKNLVGVYNDTVTGVTIAIGDGGYVARRDYTGWQPATSITGSNLNAIWGVGSTMFVASGNGIYMSTNDGATFTGPVLTGTVYNALWGQSASDVYAVGAAGALAHYNGAWSPMPSIGTKTLHGIWGDSSTDIFVVGNGGEIEHYDGVSWTAQTSGAPNNDLFGVWGSSGTDVYVAGGAGTILHYDGTTWRRVTSNTGQDLETVGGASHDDVFVGGRGTLLHYLGGPGWSSLGLPFDDVYGMYIQPDNSFFVGNIATLTTTDGSAMFLGRTILPIEGRCGDPWDNDGDGNANCKDTDCVADANCTSGGACQPTTELACGSVTSASTFTGIGRLDDLPCLDHSTPGPEATYRMTAPADGQITVTLDEPTGILDLVQLDPYTATPACDPGHCTAATVGMTGTQTLTFTATAGASYYFVVDGPANTAESFTLSIACP